MKPRTVSTREQLLQVLRDRRDELNIAHTTIDAISGLPEGYVSKVLAPQPIRNIGPTSLRALLGALALGIVRVVIVEDEEQAAKVRRRWIPRKRPPTAPPLCVAGPAQPSFDFDNTTEASECRNSK